MWRQKFINITKIIMPFIISLVILIFLVKEINPHTWVDSIYDTNLWVIIIPFLIYPLIKIINTLRYSTLFKINNFVKVFSILNYCNLILNIIPFRLGEYSYVAQLNSNFHIPKVQGLNKLVLIRIADYLVTYLLFIISNLYIGYNAKNQLIGKISIFFAASLIIITIFIFVLYFFLKNQILSRSRIAQLNKIEIYLNKGISGISEITKEQLVKGFVLTIIYWLLRLIMGYIVLNLLGINLGVFDVIFISLTIQLVGMLPINTFAGFGTFEATGTILLNQYGFNASDATTAFLKFHILTLMPMIFYGIGCWIILRLKYQSTHSYSSKFFN